MASIQEVNERSDFFKGATLGVQICSSLMNICGHFDYLQKTGFYTENHREFLDRAVLKFPGTEPLLEQYFKSTDALKTDYGFTFVNTSAGPIVHIEKPMDSSIPKYVTTKANETSDLDGAIKFEELVTSITADNFEVTTLVSDMIEKPVAPVFSENFTLKVEETVDANIMEEPAEGSSSTMAATSSNFIKETASTAVAEYFAVEEPALKSTSEVSKEPASITIPTDAYDDVADSAVEAVRAKGCELHLSRWAPPNFKRNSQPVMNPWQKFAESCAGRGIKIEKAALATRERNEEKEIGNVNTTSRYNESKPHGYGGVAVKYTRWHSRCQ